jgi:hypothetical protein
MEIEDVTDEEEYLTLSPLVGIPPSIIHRSLKKQYFYLASENNRMEHDFYLDDSSSETQQKIQVHLGLYNISDHIRELPFLSFIQKKQKDSDTQMYSFPGFEYSPTIPNSERKENQDENDDMESANHDMFMNACLEHIFDLFQFRPESMADTTATTSFSQNYYKGYLKTSATDYLVLFDCSFFIQNEIRFYSKSGFPGSEEYTWSILHELLNEQKIDDIPIHPYVKEQLLNNDFLLYITDDKGAPADIPFMLYGCCEPREKSKRSLKKKPELEPVSESKPESTSIFPNLFGSATALVTASTESSEKKEIVSSKTIFANIKRSNALSKNTNMLLPRIDHPEYGYYYFFSSDKIISSPDNIISSPNKNSESDSYKKYVVFMKHTFYDILPKTLSKNLKTGKSKLEEIYEDADVDVTNEKNTSTYFSSIYFQESNIPFWCVKSSDFFMEF